MIVRVRPVFEGSVIVFTDVATSVTVDTMVFARISLYLSENCTFDIALVSYSVTVGVEVTVC